MIIWKEFWKWWNTPKRVALQVGDKMPPRDPEHEGKPMGAMIKVCPHCDRIDAIFFP